MGRLTAQYDVDLTCLHSLILALICFDTDWLAIESQIVDAAAHDILTHFFRCSVWGAHIHWIIRRYLIHNIDNLLQVMKGDLVGQW